MRSNGVGGGGLLSAARSFKERVYFSEAEAKFHVLAEKHPKTMDAPANIFSNFVSSYDLSKAALLVHDHDKNQFIHMASEGYDLTTVRRLRVATDLFQPIAIQSLSKDEISLFRVFFSVREYSLIQNFLILAAIEDDQVKAVICITEAPDLFFLNPPSFPREISDALHSSSTELFGKESMGLPLLSIKDAEDRFTELLSDYDFLQAGLLDCSALIPFLHLRNAKSDPYILLEQGIDFAAAQLRNSFSDSQLLNLSEQRLLIILPKLTRSRAGALFHQTALSIRSRFGSLKDVPQISLKSAEIAKDGLSFQELFPDSIQQK